MVFVKPGSPHPLLVEPYVGVAAVGLDYRPDPTVAEHTCDPHHDPIEGVYVMEDVDAEHNLGLLVDLGVGDIEVLECRIGRPMSRLRMRDHPRVDVQAEKLNVRTFRCERCEDVPGAAAHLNDMISGASVCRDISGDEGYPPPLEMALALGFVLDRRKFEV